MDYVISKLNDNFMKIRMIQDNNEKTILININNITCMETEKNKTDYSLWFYGVNMNFKLSFGSREIFDEHFKKNQTNYILK